MWGRDFRIRTSADVNQWQDVMVADSATGVARFPSGIANAATGKKQSSLIFLPLADTETFVYQMDRTKGMFAKLSSVTPDILAFSTNAAASFVGPAMRGLAMVRLWNVTKSPAQAAWAKWDTALNGDCRSRMPITSSSGLRAIRSRLSILSGKTSPSIFRR